MHVGLGTDQAPGIPVAGQLHQGNPFLGKGILRRQVHGDIIPGVIPVADRVVVRIHANGGVIGLHGVPEIAIEDKWF